MNQVRKIHFHVGAHKTATTYIQSRLRSNKQRLRNEGITFVDLWAKREEEANYRKTLKAALEGDQADERKAAQASRQLREIVSNATSSEQSVVLMSYENVLGDFDLTKNGVPYPHAEQAVDHIVQAFPDSDVKIFFAFRSLDRFLESGYVQRVCTRLETRKFREYVDQVDTDSLSWIPVVQAMASTVGHENVVAWGYEDFVANEHPVWNALLCRDDANAALVSPAKKTNNSLSSKGLKYMRGINRLATAADARRFRPFIRKNYGSQPGTKSLKLLDDERRQVLISNYNRNRSEIGSCCQLLSEPQRRR